MANPDRSFADRAQRGKDLQVIIKGLVPPFVPADANISPTGFKTYLDGIDAANEAVTQAETDDTDAADLRRGQAGAIQTIALSLKDHVTSTLPWKKWHTPVSRAADAVRGYTLPKPKATPAPGTPPKKTAKGRLSQQSYADIDKLFGKLIAAVGKITGYTSVPGSGLALTELVAQRTAFQAQNEACTTTESDLESAVSTRLILYTDKETGLSAKMKAIKKAVRSQYKAGSAAYASVKAVKV